jgi:hypothetical protein
LIPKLKDASTDRRQRSVVSGAFSLLQLPKLESEVLSYVLRERLEDLPGVAFPGNHRVLRRFRRAAHESEYNRKARIKYTTKCISLSSRDWKGMAISRNQIRISAKTYFAIARSRIRGCRDTESHREEGKADPSLRSG